MPFGHPVWTSLEKFLFLEIAPSLYLPAAVLMEGAENIKKKKPPTPSFCGKSGGDLSRNEPDTSLPRRGGENREGTFYVLGIMTLRSSVPYPPFSKAVALFILAGFAGFSPPVRPVRYPPVGPAEPRGLWNFISSGGGVGKLPSQPKRTCLGDL